MTNFNWTITNIECKPQAEDQTNVVTTVYWKCEAIHDDLSHSTYVERNTTLKPYKKGSTFIPYEQLTETQVLDWVWNTKPFLPAHQDTVKQVTEAELAKVLDDRINPPTVSTPFPWG